MVAKIHPTVGRIVYYHSPDPGPQGSEPLMAFLCAVHSDTAVNLLVVNHDGTLTPKLGVTLVADGDVKPNAGYCYWMPYQLGQAAKTEEALAAAATPLEHAKPPTTPAPAPGKPPKKISLF